MKSRWFWILVAAAVALVLLCAAGAEHLRWMNAPSG